MSQNNVYLITRNNFRTDFSVPYLWCTLKTFYEENSSKADQWNWCDPYLSEYTEEELFLKFESVPPHVFGLSVYVWNEEYFDKLAHRIKTQYPDCLIVYGGPQQKVKYDDDYFKHKPWVDIVLPSDAYGEIILKEILDHYPIQDFEQIPYIYYTNSKRDKFASVKTIEKRSFKWPSNVFKAQEEHILEKIQLKKFKNVWSVVYYETSRGCPYKCIYCDWGGGTHTKISKKPFTTVLDELEWLAKIAKVDSVEIVDANFGIMSIDIEIAQHLANLKNTYNYPKLVEIESAKNHLDNVVAIKKLFLSAGLLRVHKIAIQTLDSVTQKNIDRIDIPFKDQVAAIKMLQAELPNNPPVLLEAIIGLPGDSYQAICDQLDMIHSYGLELGSSWYHAWMLLPEAPAYSPEMREKFKIKTVNKIVDINPKIKPGFDVIDQTEVSIVDNWNNDSIETVVSTYSYDVTEWIRMFRLSNFVVAGHSTGLNSYLIRYIVDHHNATPSQILTLILNYQFRDIELSKLFESEKLQTEQWVTGDRAVSGVDVSAEFPIIMPHYSFFALIMLTHTRAFYQEISQMLFERYRDDKILDLGNYLIGALISIDYDSSMGRTFSTDYNWLSYFENATPLTMGKYTFKILDKTILINTNQVPQTWQQYDNQFLALEKYYYQAVSQSSNSKISNTIKLL